MRVSTERAGDDPLVRHAAALGLGTSANCSVANRPRPGAPEPRRDQDQWLAAFLVTRRLFRIEARQNQIALVRSERVLPFMRDAELDARTMRSATSGHST